MPGTRIVWLPEAVDDLRRLRAFIEPHHRSAARRAGRRIGLAADQLIEFPELGRPLADGTGRRDLVVPFGAGAYVIRYRLHGGMAVIIRVWHSREHRE